MIHWRFPIARVCIAKVVKRHAIAAIEGDAAPRDVVDGLFDFEHDIGIEFQKLREDLGPNPGISMRFGYGKMFEIGEAIHRPIPN